MNNLYNSKTLKANLPVLLHINHAINKKYSIAEYLRILHCSKTTISGKCELERDRCNEQITATALYFSCTAYNYWKNSVGLKIHL